MGTGEDVLASVTARNRYPRELAAALIALVMLSYASVQSIVMQTAMAFGADTSPLCGAATAGEDSISMSGMGVGRTATASPHSRSRPQEHGHRVACPYCAAAAHAPVITTVAPLQISTAFVFAAFRVTAGRGPRGPPACQPRARGPPADPLTA